MGDRRARNSILDSIRGKRLNGDDDDDDGDRERE